MNERDRKSQDEEALVRALGELSGAEADASFRARLRADFVAGELAEGAPGARTRAPRRASWWWWWAVPALVAASAVVVLLGRAPALRVVAADGTGNIRIDATTATLASREEWADRIRAGARVETPPDGSFDALVDGVVLYEVAGGTRMTIPRSPGRWFNSAVECTLQVGELRIRTGPRFPGRTLRVYTPEGVTVITGTLVSVQCSDNGTCVCVEEGTAHVGVSETSLEAVTPGYRKVMLRDGTVKIIPIEPTHRAHLVEFDSRLGRIVNP